MSRGQAALLGLTIATLASATAQAQRAAYEELQTFSGVLNHVRLNYVDTVHYGALVAAAIRGVLAALDPHSHFVSRAEWEKRSALERGELATVGLELDVVDGVPTVLHVWPGSPSARAGVLAGDRLVAVDDSSIAGLDVEALELRLAGIENSRVRLRLERGPRLEPDTFSVAVKRKRFDMLSVSTVRMVDSVTGYLRLENFLGQAAKEVHDGLKRLRGRGARQVVLDLRGNPGGSVLEAVEVAAEFFPRGTVVFATRGRKRDVDTTFMTTRDGEFRTVPLAVLIDEGSASASEALAGSLQDHDRAIIIGRRSFGKALMQTVFLLPHGDQVWLTVGRVVTPNGRFIQRRYRGLDVAQYVGLAGTGGFGADTQAVYRTDNGREVRGGGGIAPDIALPLRAALPVWWSAATDSGFDTAVADSVAVALGATATDRARWVASPDEWRRRLVPPFLARARARLAVTAMPDAEFERGLALALAARAAEVRWGPDARDELILAHDQAVRAALESFPQHAELLAPRSK